MELFLFERSEDTMGEMMREAKETVTDVAFAVVVFILLWGVVHLFERFSSAAPAS